MEKITLGSKDLTDDYGVYVASVQIQQGTAKTKMVDIPYANGSLDLTDYYGSVPLNDLIITIKGLIIDDVYNKYLTFVEAVHGLKMKIKLSSDSTHYYYGRVSVGAMTPTKNGTFQITCDCEPTRYEE